MKYAPSVRRKTKTSGSGSRSLRLGEGRLHEEARARLSGSGTVAADAKDLGVVTGELEAVLLSHGGCPLFNRAAVDLLGAATLGAYQVVVMGVGLAVAIEGFAVGHVERVHCIDVGQGLQGTVCLLYTSPSPRDS